MPESARKISWSIAGKYAKTQDVIYRLNGPVNPVF